MYIFVMSVQIVLPLFEKGSTLKREEFAPMGANSSLLK